VVPDKVASLVYTGVQAWISETAQRSGAKVVRSAQAVLYGIVSNANGDRRIASNPAGGVKLPPIVKKPHKDLTSEQFHAPAREASRYRALVLLLSTAGLLWGEAVGYRRAGAGGQPYSSATGSHRPGPRREQRSRSTPWPAESPQ
jgi:hypothetical protein